MLSRWARLVAVVAACTCRSVAGEGVANLVITLDAPELTGGSGAEFPVVTDGITEANWAPTEAPAKPTVQLTNMPQNKFKLSTTESETRTFARPVLSVGNSSVVSPAVMGRLRRGGEVNSKASDLVVKYNCIAPGTSTIKATLPFANPEEAGDDKIPISFMWSVECRSLPKPGFEVTKVPYAMAAKDWAAGGEPVAVDGDTKNSKGENTKWSVAVDMSGAYLPAKPEDLFAAGSSENVTRFIVGLKPGDGKGKRSPSQAFLQPMVTASPEGIASPTVGGTGRKGGTIREVKAGKFMGIDVRPAFAYKTLDVEYRCFAPGTVTITVEIPFPENNFAPVIFAWTKTCGGETPSDLSIITSYDEAVVVKGAIQSAWMPISGDHSVFSSEYETIFRLSKQKGTRQTTRLDTPSITAVSTSDPEAICNPTLDGSGRKGGTIRAPDKGAPLELKVLYNCVKAGTAIITMEIPLAMSVEPLTISWTKTCGGIARQFFSVTTWEKDVVKDGITYDDWSPEYVGEPFFAVVDSSEHDSSFYVSLEAVDESNVGFYEADWADWMDDVEEPEVPPSMMAQTFQRPKIETSNPATCNPSLSGTASKGGTVASYSSTESRLDVHYHCLRPGEATITITIPVGVYADVVFAWTKVCNKEFVEGLSVGLSPDTEEVVSDGHAQVLFDTSPTAEGRRMVVDKDTKESSFYVHTASSARRLDFKEPHVSADPPICAPRVSGVMRKGGELAPDDPQQLTVRYNCAVGGSTVITMRIPLEDESKEAITWAWRKNNGPAPVVSAAMNGGGHWENHEVGSLLMVVLVLVIVGYCMTGKNESNKGFSRVPQHDTWESMGKAA